MNKDGTLSSISVRMTANQDSTHTPIMYRKTVILTPIEQLLANKRIVEARCNIQEKKLQEDFEFINNNASSLLFSGLVSLLFSSGHTRKKPVTSSVALINDFQPAQNNDRLTLSNLFVVAKKMLPVAWEIAQPLLINWGIKKAKSLIFGLFTKKKSATPA